MEYLNLIKTIIRDTTLLGILLPESLRWALIFNPFADIMALIQGWIHGFPIDPGNWLRPLGMWLILLTPAWVLFRRTEPHMREVL